MLLILIRLTSDWVVTINENFLHHLKKQKKKKKMVVSSSYQKTEQRVILFLYHQLFFTNLFFVYIFVLLVELPIRPSVIMGLRSVWWYSNTRIALPLVVKRTVFSVLIYIWSHYVAPKLLVPYTCNTRGDTNGTCHVPCILTINMFYGETCRGHTWGSSKARWFPYILKAYPKESIRNLKSIHWTKSVMQNVVCLIRTHHHR